MRNGKIYLAPNDSFEKFYLAVKELINVCVKYINKWIYVIAGVPGAEGNNFSIYLHCLLTCWSSTLCCCWVHRRRECCCSVSAWKLNGIRPQLHPNSTRTKNVAQHHLIFGRVGKANLWLMIRALIRVFRHLPISFVVVHDSPFPMTIYVRFFQWLATIELSDYGSDETISIRINRVILCQHRIKTQGGKHNLLKF